MAAPPGPAGGRQVCVVGDVGVDVLAQVSGPVVAGQDTRAKVRMTPGGAGGNTAAWLAALGVPVHLIARVGDDDAGRSATAELTSAGVRCRLAVDPVRSTCCVVVIAGPDGDRTMLPDRGANGALSIEDVVLPVLPGRGHLHLSGYVLLDDSSRPAGLAALAAARAAGWSTSVDPQTTTHLLAIGAATFLSWIEGVDLLLPNDCELAALGGADPVLDRVRAIAVTHGNHGASWLEGDRQIHVPAPQMLRTESTGSGDAFDAGLIAVWLSGADPETALRSGVSAGTAAAGAPGGRPRRTRSPRDGGQEAAATGPAGNSAATT